jgi:hypothetical protein
MNYPLWRRIHLISSGLIAIISIAHLGLTFGIYHDWTPDAVWFFGAGLGLMLIAVSNLAHIGVEPCRQPTTRLIRLANWVYAGFGLATLIAVPEPQAFVLVALLWVQAIASHKTLPGPVASES